MSSGECVKYGNRARVLADVVACVNRCRYLHPKIMKARDSDGASVNLLGLQGVVVMQYGPTQYNIPVGD